jgi:hypothetical protein
MAEGFDFDEWLATLKLCGESVDKLKAAKVRSAESVLLLSRYDITALKLDIGDHGAFKKAILLLRDQFPSDEDIANASTSSHIDDSFDGTNPDHVNVHQGSQLDAINKLRIEQERLAIQQSQLKPVIPTNVGHLPQVSATSPQSSSIDQLSSLLTSLNLRLVTGIEGPLASSSGQGFQQPPVFQPPVSPIQGAASLLPGAALFGPPATQIQPNAGNQARNLPFMSAATGGLPFVGVPPPSYTLPFTGVSPTLQSGVLPTTSSLAQHPALKNLTDSSISASIKDLLGIEECGRLACNAKKGEKPLFPIDFVTITPGVVTGEEDIINQNNGVELVIRNVGAKKPTPDKLTTGQYIEACNLIFKILLPTFSLQDLIDYIEFQRQIGYFMQIFSIGSVFILDHEHRKNVFAKKSKWHEFNQSLATGTLKSKQKVETKQTVVKQKSNGASRASPVTSGTPCSNYNDQGKYCSFNPCRNPHRCSVEGCFQSHPAYKHGSNFRSNSHSSVTNP